MIASAVVVTSPGGQMAALVPEWLGVTGAVIFVAIAASHLRHLATATGQRRQWHTCHVLIAVGMVFMYVPPALDPVNIPAGLWRIVFALACVLAALWSMGGVQRAPTLIWLLTAVDLGAMVGMWTPNLSASLRWTLILYLGFQASLWALDTYRRLDRSTPVISWSGLSASPAGASLSVACPPAQSLIGDLDINASMVAMSVGMAWMFAAMQLVS